MPRTLPSTMRSLTWEERLIALRGGTLALNRPPYRLPTGPRPQRPAPSFVDDEIRDAWLSQQSIDDIYDDIAADDLLDAARADDRAAMMRGAVSSDGPTRESRHMLAIQAANKPTMDRARQAAKDAGTYYSGRKRKLDASFEDDLTAYKQNLDHMDLNSAHVDLTCDQVRTRINKLIESGTMGKGEFCEAIGVSNAAVNAFLKKCWAMDGASSQVYPSAWEFFKKRDIVGLQLPNAGAKKRKTHANPPRQSSPPANPPTGLRTLAETSISS